MIGKKDEVIPEVWVSKYALTDGIRHHENVKRSLDAPDMIVVEISPRGTIYFHGEGKNWHLTPYAAKVRAKEMAEKKVASLKKQMKKAKKQVEEFS